MRTFFTFLVILCICSCKQHDKSQPEETMENKARKIHDKVIVLDTHIDINVANFTDSINYTQDLDTQVNLPKMKKGGLDVAWLIVYTGQDTLTDEGYAKASENAMAKFDAIHRLCSTYAPEDISLALTGNDVRRIHAQGKKVAMIGVENAYPIGKDLSNFKKYHELGARYISLSHNGHSQFCDSHTGEKEGKWLHNGLSELGEKAVREMNRLGIMIDVSHVSKDAMMQMVALSQAPVIASHSSARALCDHSRNLDDEQLDAIKENGGVVQTVAFSAYLNTEKHETRNKYEKKLQQHIADSLGVEWHEFSQFGNLTKEQQETFTTQYRKIRKMAKYRLKKDQNAPKGVDVKDFVDHIDYLVDRIGIDHVGISSDFDGGGGISDWNDASETFNVTLELVKRGYTEEDIKKLWGDNLLRVLDEVQKFATTKNPSFAK